MSDIDQGATPEVEKPEVEIEQPKSMDDTIRETLRSLQDKGAEISTEAPEDEKADKIRDESGKFASDKTPAEPVAQEIKAPNTWKKESHDAYAKADPVLRSEIERREADFHKGIEQYRQAATFAQSIDAAISPYKQTLQSLGVAPEKAIAELMAADHRLRYGSAAEKSQYFAQLAHSYGVDIAQTAEIKVDPQKYELEQQNNQLRQYYENTQLMNQRQQEQSLNSEISAFAADPKHSHFEQVKGHMAALLQAQQAKTLDDAYEQAIYANPATRAAVLQQQATEQKAESAKKAQAAKDAASVNMRSRASIPASQPIGTMDDTIRATYRRLTGVA